MEAFQRENLVTDDPPVVAVNANSGNPHYEPRAEHPVPIREGDFVLLDVWAKKNMPGAVYYDITWIGFGGTERLPTSMREIFKIVREARDAGVKTVQEAITAGRPICRMGSGPRGPRHISRRPDTASISFIAPGTPSAPKCMPTAPTWTISRFTTSARFCPTPASPSSPEFICRSSACAAK